MHLRVLGLAIGMGSEQFLPNIMQQLATQGLISAPIITFRLPPISDSDANSSTVTFGAPNASSFDNGTRVTQGNATTDGFWDLTMTPNVEGNNLFGSNATRTARVNTKVNVIGLPASDMQAVIGAFPEARKAGQGLALPCNATSTFSMEISGQQFTLPPENFISTIADSDFEGYCFTRFSVQDGNVWTLGSPFTSECDQPFFSSVNDLMVKLLSIFRWTFRQSRFPSQILYNHDNGIKTIDSFSDLYIATIYLFIYDIICIQSMFFKRESQSSQPPHAEGQLKAFVEVRL